MAVDKLVDSAQLDADLGDIADAIRAKGGTSAQLAFPAGFVSAVQAIPTGGGYTLEELLAGTEPSGDLTIITAPAQSYGLAFKSQIGKVTASYSGNVISNGNCLFQGSGITEFVGLGITHFNSSSCFNGCTNLTKITAPNATYFENLFAYGCTSLRIVDIYGGAINRGNVFSSCTGLTTLILRGTTLCTLGAIGNFNNTPFASGQSGGTIYIPKSLYDHLGDGTSLDYKAATNWSTLDGYGTVTWAQIEGSIYETQYADGTPIT